MKKLSLVLSAAALCAAAIAFAASPPVGYQSLADLDRLWQWTGRVETRMSSSTSPTNGNMDMSNFHGRFRGEKVMARIDGPGCVYRIWSALPSGTIKVYLDGSNRPQINCAFKDYLAGKCPGLPGEFAVGRAANYMPIPFARSIVITAPGFKFPGYYQVSYQTYDPSVEVVSFNKDAALDSPGLEAARGIWADGAGGPCPCRLRREKESKEIASGQKVAALRLDGPGVIRELCLFNPDDPADPLEEVRLLISWDTETGPAVDAPADAFFINRFDLKGQWPGGSLRNMFVQANDRGYCSSFPMPFDSRAALELQNDGPSSRRLEVAAIWQELPSLPEEAMRFHAAYHERDYESDFSTQAVITMNTPIDPSTNYVVLEREGTGHYLGCALFVRSVGTIWWGEGDENTYVDGESAPGIQGTGTEDEFNWSWGFMPHMSPVSGTLPVVPECKENIAAQIIPKLRNPECNRLTGHNAAYRFRPSDYVPFKKSIRVSYEILGASWAAPHNIITGNLSQKRGDDYASMAYWYELP